MNKKILSVVAGIFAIGSAQLFAQTISGKQDFTSGFKGIEVSDYFTATLKNADYYGVEWTVEEDLKNYMHVYVRGEELVATVDRKALDSETKKKYAGKNASKATLQVVIYAPSVSSIKVADDALLQTEGFNNGAESVVLDASGNAIVKSLDLNCSAVTLTASKKAVIEAATVSADQLSVNLLNSAVATVSHDSKKLTVNANATSNLTIDGTCVDCEIEAANSSLLNIKGSAVNMDMKASGKEIHAESFLVEEAKVFGSNGCKAYINVSDSLSLELKGGCHLSYGGTPKVDIVSINLSSVSKLNL